MLTLTHTHLDGTLLEGTSRGDGSAAALKPLGWRWSRNLEAWYVPRSRDTDGQQWRIKATVEALEAADFEVTVDVDNTPRATADVHADKIARASARADALERKAARLESKSDAHYAAAKAITENIPFGQPIIVGHHSEARARRDAARVHSNMNKSIEAADAASEAARKAEAARANTRPESVETLVNRLEKLEADIRRCERLGRNPQRLEHLREQHAYWTSVHDQYRVDGRVADTTNVKVGDLARYRWDHWFKVERVNAKTLTLKELEHPYWSTRVDRRRITEIKPQ